MRPGLQRLDHRLLRGDAGPADRSRRDLLLRHRRCCRRAAAVSRWRPTRRDDLAGAARRVVVHDGPLRPAVGRRPGAAHADQPAHQHRARLPQVPGEDGRVAPDGDEAAPGVERAARPDLLGRARALPRAQVRPRRERDRLGAVGARAVGLHVRQGSQRLAHRPVVGALLQAGGGDAAAAERVLPPAGVLDVLQRLGRRSRAAVVGRRQLHVVERLPARRLDVAALGGARRPGPRRRGGEHARQGRPRERRQALRLPDPDALADTPSAQPMGVEGTGTDP